MIYLPLIFMWAAFLLLLWWINNIERRIRRLEERPDDTSRIESSHAPDHQRTRQRL